MEHVNEMAHRRSMNPDMDSKSSGKSVKQSSNVGAKKGSANFKNAADVLGSPVIGELEVPQSSVVKGASSVQFQAPLKGREGKSLSGSVRKPKNAIDSGH